MILQRITSVYFKVNISRVSNSFNLAGWVSSARLVCRPDWAHRLALCSGSSMQSQSGAGAACRMHPGPALHTAHGVEDNVCCVQGQSETHGSTGQIQPPWTISSAFMRYDFSVKLAIPVQVAKFHVQMHFPFLFKYKQQSFLSTVYPITQCFHVSIDFSENHFSISRHKFKHILHSAKKR